MENLPPEDDVAERRTPRQSRRSILVAIAVLALHPLNLPPVKVDFHITFDTRPYAEATAQGQKTERD